jgi:hypothetical protein
MADIIPIYFSTAIMHRCTADSPFANYQTSYNHYMNTSVAGYAGRLAITTATSAYQCRLFCIRRIACIGYNYNRVATGRALLLSSFFFLIFKPTVTHNPLLGIFIDLTKSNKQSLTRKCVQLVHWGTPFE